MTHCANLCFVGSERHHSTNGKLEDKLRKRQVSLSLKQNKRDSPRLLRCLQDARECGRPALAFSSALISTTTAPGTTCIDSPADLWLANDMFQAIGAASEMRWDV